MQILDAETLASAQALSQTLKSRMQAVGFKLRGMVANAMMYYNTPVVRAYYSMSADAIGARSCMGERFADELLQTDECEIAISASLIEVTSLGVDDAVTALRRFNTGQTIVPPDTVLGDHLRQAQRSGLLKDYLGRYTDFHYHLQANQDLQSRNPVLALVLTALSTQFVLEKRTLPLPTEFQRYVEFSARSESPMGAAARFALAPAVPTREALQQMRAELERLRFGTLRSGPRQPRALRATIVRALAADALADMGMIEAATLVRASFQARPADNRANRAAMPATAAIVDESAPSDDEEGLRF